MVKERQVGVGVTTEGRSCKQLVRLFAEWISAGVITQSVAMSDARSTDPRRATRSKMRCAWAKPI